MNWLIFIVGIILVFVVIRLVFVARPGVTLEQARTDLNAGRAILVDVREPAECEHGVAEHAIVLPFSNFERRRSQQAPALEKLRGKKLLLYCQSGTRSGMMAAQLRKKGFDAINLGSLARCQRGGWVVKPPGRDP